MTVPKVQAWERLNDHEYAGTLDMEGFYNLFIDAGYSEEVAQVAASQRGWERLLASEKM